MNKCRQCEFDKCHACREATMNVSLSIHANKLRRWRWLAKSVDRDEMTMAACLAREILETIPDLDDQRPWTPDEIPRREA